MRSYLEATETNAKSLGREIRKSEIKICTCKNDLPNFRTQLIYQVVVLFSEIFAVDLNSFCNENDQSSSTRGDFLKQKEDNIEDN